MPVLNLFSGRKAASFLEQAKVLLFTHSFYIVLAFFVFLIPGCWVRQTTLLTGSVTVQTDEHLVSVSNSARGTEIELHVVGPGEGGQHLSKTIVEGRLSPACGERFERCKKLVTVERKIGSSPNSTVVQLILFVPVEGGLRLVDVRADPNEITIQEVSDTIATGNCDPAAIYETRHRRQLACIEIIVNSKVVIGFYDIVFDPDAVSNTKLRSVYNLSLPSFDLSVVSNFVYVSLSSEDDDQWVYFTVSNSLRAFSPFVVLDYGAKLPNCTAASQVSHVRDSVLIATCHSGSVVYFDLYELKAINQTVPSEHPYPCPSPDVDLKAYPTAEDPFIRFRHWSTGQEKDINLLGQQYNSGQCFGTDNLTLFCYEDQEQGTYCINLLSQLTSNTVHLSSNPCPPTGCHPWAVFEHRYLLVPEGEGIDSSASVVDCMNMFLTIIVAEHVPTDMITIAHLPTTSTKPILPTQPVTKEKDGIDPRWWSTLTIPGLLAINIVVVVSVYMVCRHRRQQRSVQYAPFDQSSTSDSAEGMECPSTTVSLTQTLCCLRETPDGHIAPGVPTDLPADPSLSVSPQPDQSAESLSRPSNSAEYDRSHIAPGVPADLPADPSLFVSPQPDQSAESLSRPSNSAEYNRDYAFPFSVGATSPNTVGPFVAPSVVREGAHLPRNTLAVPVQESNQDSSTSDTSDSVTRIQDARPTDTDSLKQQMPRLLLADDNRVHPPLQPHGTNSAPSGATCYPTLDPGVDTNTGARSTEQVASGMSPASVVPGSFPPFNPENIHKRDLEHDTSENRRNDLTEKADHLQNLGASQPPLQQVTHQQDHHGDRSISSSAESDK